MRVSARNSLIMLERCKIYSEHRQTEVFLSEPDDGPAEVMCEFATNTNNVYDAINDTYLWELLEAIFERKEK